MAVLDEIARAIGEQAADGLWKTFRGCRVYVPVKPNSTGEIVEAIGPEAASRLSRVFGGEQIDVPVRDDRRSNREEIVQLFGAGMAVRMIARRLGISERRVQQVLASPITKLRRS